MHDKARARTTASKSGERDETLISSAGALTPRLPFDRFTALSDADGLRSRRLFAHQPLTWRDVAVEGPSVQARYFVYPVRDRIDFGV
jgi:hypothetical protein